jgi:amino acid transporter
VLPDWFRAPHKKFGTSARIITMIVVLQIITVVLTRGNIQLLGDAYAFGIVWSFALQGLAVFVLRFKQPEEPQWKVPSLAFAEEVPSDWAVPQRLALRLLISSLKVATIWGLAFTASSMPFL